MDLTALFALLSFLLSSCSASLSGSCPTNSSTLRTVGYYEAWSPDRSCNAVFPETVWASGYTHLNFAYAWIDPGTYEVSPIQYGDTSLWNRLTAIRELNPGLQIWLSIGGWAMNNPDQPTATTFSQLVNDKTQWSKFFTSLLEMVQAYGFDGVDLDWQTPGVAARGGSSNDVVNYPYFLQNLRGAMAATGFTYGLSITLPADPSYLQYYRVSELAGSVDWFNVMNLELYANTSVTTAHYESYQVRDVVTQLGQAGVDGAKVTLGLSYYGKSATLADPGCTGIACKVIAPGVPAPCSRTPGVIDYDEIMQHINNGVPSKYNALLDVNIATFGDQWFSYENEQTFASKIAYANQQCLGGTAVWAVTGDKSGAGVNALAVSTGQFSRAASAPDLSDTATQCQWTDCINGDAVCPGVGGGGGAPCVPECPAGTTQSWMASGPQVCGIGSSGFRRFCCPNNARTTCEVSKSVLPRPSCNGRCNGDQIKIGSDTTGCVVGSNDVCCTRTKSLAAQQQCAWSTRCSFAGDCPNDKPNLIAYTGALGDGSQTCVSGKVKSLCCSNPNPYENCKWNRGPFGGDACQGVCSTGQTIVATTSDKCTSGSQVLCCNGVSNDESVAKFKLQLEAFVTNPTCPANQVVETGINYPDTLNYEATFSEYRRDSSSLDKRDFNAFGGISTINQLVGIQFSISNRSIQWRGAFDQTVGQINMNGADYVEDMNNHPGWDPTALVQQRWCSWRNARLQRQQGGNTATQICVLAWHNDTIAPASTFQKRVFNDDINNSNPTNAGNTFINTGALVSRILHTTNVRFLYARPLEYAWYGMVQGQATIRPQTILEVAYDIRQAPELQQTPADIFAVFHFHINILEANPSDATQPLYPQINFVNVLHGQTVYNANANDPTNYREWRVDTGRNPADRAAGGRNQRTDILRCEEEDVWYPGDPDLAGSTDYVNLLGEQLRNQGILAPGGALNHWDSTNGQWTWAPQGQRSERDWPNAGVAQAGVRFQPMDMRPNSQGGTQGWPESPPPPPPPTKL